MADPLKQRQAMLDVIARSKQRLVEARAETIAARPGITETAVPAFLTERRPQAPPAAAEGGGGGGVSAKDSRGHFVTAYAGKIQEFVADASRSKLELPSSLSGYDRKVVHEIAQKFNLSHHSVGAGMQRRLVLTKDELFFKADIKPSELTLTELANQPTSRRDARDPPLDVSEKSTYADKSLFKSYKKLRQATNPEAKASETALSAEELTALARATTAPRTAEADEWAHSVQAHAKRAPSCDQDPPAQRGPVHEAPVAQEAAQEAAPEAAVHVTPVAALAEMGRGIGLPEADVVWIERFAASRLQQGFDGDRVLFPLDPCDVATATPAALPDGCSMLFAKAAPPSEGAPVTPVVNQLLKAIEERARPGLEDGATAIQDLFVAFIDESLDAIVAVVLVSTAAAAAMEAAQSLGLAAGDHVSAVQ